MNSTGQSLSGSAAGGVVEDRRVVMLGDEGRSPGGAAPASPPASCAWQSRLGARAEASTGEIEAATSLDLTPRC